MLVWSLTTTWAENGMDGLATTGNVFKILLAILFGMIVVNGWITVMYPTFFKPEQLMSEGINISSKMDQILNFPRAWIMNITLFGKDIRERIMKDIGYSSITGADMKYAFEVRHVPPSDSAKESASERQKKAAEQASDKSGDLTWHWILSYGVYLFGPLILLFQIIRNGIIDVINWIIALFMKSNPATAAISTGLQAATSIAAGENPVEALKGAVINQIPGGSTLMGMEEQAEKAASTVKKAKGAAQAAIDTAREVASDPLAAVSGVIPKFKIPKIPTGFRQGGGARDEEPSTQSMIMGASVFALAGGAAIKLAVDYLLPTQ